jgi:dihydroorotate dehydrogenase electron transfer subunit
LVVGGGIGTAPLMMLVSKFVEIGNKVMVIEGASTKKELIFLNKLEEFSRKGLVRLIFTTEDGTFGIKGLATDAVEKTLSLEKYDVIYVCGNEKMTCKIFSIAEKNRLFIQASLERIMLCSIGICGSCVIGKYRVCKDGPIFNQDQLRMMENDLGKFKRNFKGERIPFNTK